MSPHSPSSLIPKVRITKVRFRRFESQVGGRLRVIRHPRLSDAQRVALSMHKPQRLALDAGPRRPEKRCLKRGRYLEVVLGREPTKRRFMGPRHRRNVSAENNGELATLGHGEAKHPLHKPRRVFHEPSKALTATPPIATGGTRSTQGIVPAGHSRPSAMARSADPRLPTIWDRSLTILAAP